MKQPLSTTRDQVILIVDDKESNIIALENLLAAPQRIIRTAQSGEQALRILLNETIDLIILDVQMPGMDGFEVAQLLKARKNTKDIPIIFASAEKTEHQSMMKGYMEGAVDYLSKPLNPDVAKAKVAVLLQLQLQKTELLEKNAALEKFALLINNSEDIIGIIDQESLTIEAVNPAFTAILGYREEEILNKSLLSILGDKENKQIVEGARQQERASFETRVKDKNRKIKWLEWKVVSRFGKWFVNARDITSQKKADEQILELNETLQKNVEQLSVLNKELESFSYSVSHDLRAPLRIMQGYATMLIEDYHDRLDEEGMKYLNNVSNGALRMNKLIDGLLEFSKMGRKPIQKSSVNMKQMVDKIVAEQHTARPHQVAVQVNDVYSTGADQLLINQVWTNLISNAFKYTSKKSDATVEIGSSRDESEITYYVKDNGAGFSMDYANKLFTVFQRLHKPSEFEGTGIGLAIVNRIVSKHGGRVWAEGKVNKGATFYFTLPVE